MKICDIAFSPLVLWLADTPVTFYFYSHRAAVYCRDGKTSGEFCRFETQQDQIARTVEGKTPWIGRSDVKA
jgi:hypothetical protein